MRTPATAAGAVALATDSSAPIVTTTVCVPASPAEVFALVTNAGQWPTRCILARQSRRALSNLASAGAAVALWTTEASA